MNWLSLTLAFLMTAGCAQLPSSPESDQTESPLPASQTAPDENAALASIAEVNSAQNQFFARNRRYALTYDELVEALFLTEEPATARTGYDMNLRPSPDAVRYSITAIAAMPGPSTRYFFSDQTGDIRAETGREAGAQSPRISE